MRGKRAKRMRTMAAAIFVESEREPFEPAKIKIGRKWGGPAFGRFPYPPSVRYDKRGGFDVVTLDPALLEKIAAESGAMETPK